MFACHCQQLSCSMAFFQVAGKCLSLCPNRRKRPSSTKDKRKVSDHSMTAESSMHFLCLLPFFFFPSTFTGCACGGNSWSPFFGVSGIFSSDLLCHTAGWFSLGVVVFDRVASHLVKVAREVLFWSLTRFRHLRAVCLGRVPFSDHKCRC